MSAGPYKIASHKETEIGRFTIVQDMIDRDGETFPYSFEKMEDSACVIALHNEKVVLIRQYRHTLGEWLWEFPGGGLGKDTPENTVRRELLEETGYTIGEMGYLGCFPISPGTSSARVYTYYAKCKKSGNQDLDETEIIEVCEVTEEQLQDMMDNGEFVFLTGIVMWMLYKQKKEAGILWKETQKFI